MRDAPRPDVPVVCVRVRLCVGYACHSYDFIKSTMSLDQNFYPESLFRLYIINAPFVFRMMWAVVKPWLHPITKDRIKVYSDDYLVKMQELIDLDQLPKAIGGTCDCAAAGAACHRVVQQADMTQYVAELRSARAAAATGTNAAAASSAVPVAAADA